MKPINVGLIGFGLSGRYFQAPFLHCHPGYEVLAVKSSRKGEVNKLFPNARVVQNEDEIISDPGIDLIILATPNTTHFPLAKKALQHNKHVIVEKPFVNNVKEGEELISLAKEKNKILTVFHNRRWDGDFLTLKKIVESGKLGNIVEFESHFDRFRPELNTANWRTADAPGGGMFYDLGPHLLDQALVLFGLPDALFADIRIARDKGEVDDTFELILFYKKQRVTLKSGIFVKESGPRFIIHGTKGSFVKYGMDPQEAELRKGILPNADDWGADEEKHYGLLNTDTRKKIVTEKGNYMGFFNNVYEAITGNAPIEIEPAFALENIRIIEKAFESNKTGKMVAL